MYPAGAITVHSVMAPPGELCSKGGMVYLQSKIDNITEVNCAELLYLSILSFASKSVQLLSERRVTLAMSAKP